MDISITVAEDTVRFICATVAFIAMTWGTVKMTDILFGKKKDEKETN
jgi:hypothetical protein